VLLPGMDGTGDLFKWFVEALPADFDTTVVRYPPDVPSSGEQLRDIARQAFPTTAPFVLIAESFSTPLAIQCAALNPTNLKGLVLCAGFATSPVIGWKRAVAEPIAQLSLRVTPSALAIKMLLVGWSPPSSLIQAIREAVSTVRSGALIARVKLIFRCNARAELARAKVPILYLRASQDKVIQSRSMEEILSIMPKTKVVSIRGPHLLLQREPRLSAAAIAKFIQQLENLPDENDHEG
jgi:pimeloyl-[acyl-carrier protein] methyl ester esterase